MKSTLIVIVTFAALAGAAAAQDEPADAEQAAFKRWLEFYAAEAAGYELFINDKPPQKLKLETPPLLTYTNPVRTGSQHGAIYVWTLDGRPEAIASFWSTYVAGDSAQRDVTHEFQSLSLGPLGSRHVARVGSRGPVPDWNLDRPGVELHFLAEAPAPAGSAPARLVQMRRLAQEFSAKITASNKETTSDLRLLPQPLMRYSSHSAAVIDGAMFAFVQATDPELILMIESRRTADGPRWHYLAARFTNRPLQLRHGEREVWSCDAAEGYDGAQPYFIYWSVSRRDRLLADEPAKKPAD
jgi:hypothetical protein